MDILKKRYPRTHAAGGKSLSIRPLQRGDENALLEFFKRIPVDERRMFKDDVTSPKVIKGWCSSIDFRNVLPLVVLDGLRIVADATLHRERGGWAQHVARIRLAIDPEFRGLGLGRALVTEFVELARPLNIALLDAEVMSEQKRALELFEDLEFIAVATLSQHVLDLHGQPHDVIILSHQVFPPTDFAIDRETKIEDVDVGGDA